MSCVQKPQGDSLWDCAKPYVMSPVAAGCAIVLPMYGFIVKEDQQMGRRVRPLNLQTMVSSLRVGVGAIPSVSVVVGSQMILQSAMKAAMKYGGIQESLVSTAACAVTVAAVSSPFLAWFNGRARNHSWKESWSRFTPRQAAAITFQETCFVFSTNNPLNTWMQKSFGQTKRVEYASAFMSGAACSVVGHPANTALTRWQNGKTIPSFKEVRAAPLPSAAVYMRGAVAKATAVGLFTVIYKGVKEITS